VKSWYSAAFATRRTLVGPAPIAASGRPIRIRKPLLYPSELRGHKELRGADESPWYRLWYRRPLDQAPSSFSKTRRASFLTRD
jgi:hypothetical protein